MAWPPREHGLEHVPYGPGLVFHSRPLTFRRQCIAPIVMRLRAPPFKDPGRLAMPVAWRLKGCWWEIPLFHKANFLARFIAEQLRCLGSGDPWVNELDELELGILQCIHQTLATTAVQHTLIKGVSDRTFEDTHLSHKTREVLQGLGINVHANLLQHLAGQRGQL